MSAIQTTAVATATRAIAAYDRAIVKINDLNADNNSKMEAIISLTKTILELTEMLDAKFPADVGGSVGGPELATA